MALRNCKLPDDTFTPSMAPLSFTTKTRGNYSSETHLTGGHSSEDVDIDLKEVYFLIMHFLSFGPCQRTYAQIWNELLEHELLPRRYHAWYSRSGAPSGDENDNGNSLPLSYTKLVERYPHIERDHLVKLLKQLIVSCSPPLTGMIGGNSPNAADVPTLLGTGSFSLLGSEKEKEQKTLNHLPRYLRWPHMQADQVRGISLREIGGGFSKHHRAPSVRAACYAIAKPSAMVQKMQVIKKLRGHQNAVYCAIFDRSGRYVITGSDDRLVKIWSMETAFCLASCRGHEGDITDLAVSSNNALVASASNDFIIRVWRLPDGLPISVLRGHTGAVTAIAFSPRPTCLYQLLSSSDDGTCRIWDARYSQSSPRVYIPKPPEVGPGKSVIPPANAGQQVHQILCCAYNANGTVFVTGSSDTYARVWNAYKTNPEDTEQPHHEMDLLSGHENDVNYVQFSGCAASSKFSATDSSKEDSQPKFKNSWFTHDNIVTCSRDGSAIIWIPRSRRSHGKVGRWTRAYHLKVPPPPMPPQPIRGGPRQRFQPTPRGVNMIVWSLDNRFVLAAIMDCRICVWNASDGSLVHCLIGHSESTFVLDVHPFNPRIAMSAGYDGKTIIWDIWEGTPVRIYETGRFKLVDGKFSPDGTSVVLSDEVGQIFVIATGQGESQKDARYDQFFLGDYRPLVQDTQGNVLDQETQLAPHRRNIQDLLCDSSMIPYPEPYQSMYQRRRLGALGIEWRPPSLKFAVGPSDNINGGDHRIFPILDPDIWVEPMPEFLDAMDFEQENEGQSDDNDSEYNITEEYSSEGEPGSLSNSSSEDPECSAEESEDHNNKEGLRRSKRKKLRSEVELTTSSGRRVKKRILDGHDDMVMKNQKKKKRRKGRPTSRKRTSKSKPPRPQRRAARNALTFLSKIGEDSTDGEDEDDSETYSSDNSAPPDSNTQSNESDPLLLNYQTKHSRGKEISRDELVDVTKPSMPRDSQTNAGIKRRLVLKLPIRDPKKLVNSENSQPISREEDVVVLSVTKSSDGSGTKRIHSNSSEQGQPSGDKFGFMMSQNGAGICARESEYTDLSEDRTMSAVYQEGKIRWGEVRARSSKRLQAGDACSAPSTSFEDHNILNNNANGNLNFENECQRTSSQSAIYSHGDDGSCRRELARDHFSNGSLERLHNSGIQETSSACKHVSLAPSQPSPLASDEIEKATPAVTCHESKYDATKESEGIPLIKDCKDHAGMLDTGGGIDTMVSNFNGRNNEQSENIESPNQPLPRKLKFTSKRSMNEASSSCSKSMSMTEDWKRSDSDVLRHNMMDAEHNILPVVHEEDGDSSGGSGHGSMSNRSMKSEKSLMYDDSYRRSKSSMNRNCTEYMEESTSNYDSLNGGTDVDFPNATSNSSRRRRSSGWRAASDEPNSLFSNLRVRERYDYAEASKNGFVLSSSRGDRFQTDDWKSNSKVAVGLRSTRSRHLNLAEKKKSPKLSWLMLSEHEECYRYIPQLGDEVAYLRQGHEEYLLATHSNEKRPWKYSDGELRAVEFCKVKSMEYATLPGSGESCCKLTLVFTDPLSCGYGKGFRLTLPELVTIPDFLVERTRYDSAIERNWACRDKCLVWWRNEDGEGGSWWEGRILAVKPKSHEFPESPWERYVIQYKNDSSGQHQHSPWELHDANTQWEHPCIDDTTKKKLLASISRIEDASLRNQDNCGLQKLHQVSQKSDFLNRFPVPLSPGMIKARLENDYYRSLDAFKHDVTVMLSNAQSYFSKSAEYASKMRKLSDTMSHAFL